MVTFLPSLTRVCSLLKNVSLLRNPERRVFVVAFCTCLKHVGRNCKVSID